MADRSIWYKECDKGWLDLIPSVVDCEYEEGVFSPIYTSIHLPEQDLDDYHKYPRCTVQVIDEDFAKMRYDSRPVKIISQSGASAIVQKPSMPYFLIYQINFFAQFKSDIDHITKQWRAFTGRTFSLPITLATGEPYKCATDPYGFRNNDDVEREVRRYIRSFSYRVWVDLEGSKYNAHVVTGVNVIKD